MTDGVLPSVSVCVVTYELATFLIRCLESLASEAADIREVGVVTLSVAWGALTALAREEPDRWQAP